MWATQTRGMRPNIVLFAAAILILVGSRSKNSQRAAGLSPKKLLFVAIGDHAFCLRHELFELRLFFEPGGVKLFWTGTGNNSDDVSALPGALVDKRFHTTQAVAHQNEAPIANLRHAIDGAVEVEQGFF